jgi:hypothetical protein
LTLANAGTAAGRKRLATAEAPKAHFGQTDFAAGIDRQRNMYAVPRAMLPGDLLQRTAQSLMQIELWSEAAPYARD